MGANQAQAHTLLTVDLDGWELHLNDPGRWWLHQGQHPWPTHRPGRRGGTPDSEGCCLLLLTGCHLVCEVRGKADTKLPGLPIVLCVRVLLAADHPKGLLPLSMVGLHFGT
jgi:hypothetical protein